MIGDAMDAFVRLRGEEALGKLMLASFAKVKTRKPAREYKTRPPSREGQITDKVAGHIDLVGQRFANNIFSISDVQKEIKATRGKAAHLVGVMQKLEIIHRVPSVSGEQGHRFRFAQSEGTTGLMSLNL